MNKILLEALKVGPGLVRIINPGQENNILNSQQENLDSFISTDSRSLKSGQVFIALNGERFRGANFVKNALEAGASAVVLENNAAEIDELQSCFALHKNIAFFIVENVKKYFQQLAYHFLMGWKQLSGENLVIAITGSNGKTTTKEILAHLLSACLPNKVLVTQGNLNNHFGVPMTLMRLKNHHQVAIIEMGTNSPGEIKILAEIACPDAGMITNIGPAHLEKLINLEGVYQEKTSLYHVYKKNVNKKIFILPGDDPFLSKLCAEGDTLCFYENNNRKQKDCTYQWDDHILKIGYDGDEINIPNINLMPKYLQKNMTMAYLMALKLFPSFKQKLRHAAMEFKNIPKNRGEWIEVNNHEIYLDAYNANPVSMQSSLESFGSTLAAGEECTLILGDMNELGDRAPEYHQQLGTFVSQYFLSKHPTALVVFVGRFGQDFARGVDPKHPDLYLFALKKLLEEDKKCLKAIKGRKFIFIKASRSLQLESLLDIFENPCHV